MMLTTSSLTLPAWLEAPWLQQMGSRAYELAPTIGGALAILIVGWLAAFVVSRLVLGGLKRTTFDDKVASWLGYNQAGDKHIEQVVAKTVYYTILAFVAVILFSYLGIDSVTQPLLTVLDGFASAVPNILKAVLIGVFGFLVATGVRLGLEKLLVKLNIDGRLRRLSGDEGSDHKIAHTIATAAYVFIIIIAAVPVLEALKLGALAGPLSTAFASVTTYLPRFVGAIILMIVGYFVSKIAKRAVAGVLRRVGVDNAMKRIGVSKVFGDQRLSDILGSVVMAFLLLQFAISAVGRLQIDEIGAPLSVMLQTIYTYFPKLVMAGVLLAVGTLLARIAGNVASKLLAAVGFNTLLSHIGIYRPKSAEAAQQQERAAKTVLQARQQNAQTTASDRPQEDAGDQEDELLVGRSTSIRTPADVLGLVVATVVVLLALRQALGILQLDGLALLLDRLLRYSPNALVAAVIVGFGFWTGNWAKRRIGELTASSDDRLARRLGSVAYVGILVVTTMMALKQLGVAEQLVVSGFTLMLGSVCLALALAFGLGGREVAAKLLDEEYRRRKGDDPQQ